MNKPDKRYVCTPTKPVGEPTAAYIENVTLWASSWYTARQLAFVVLHEEPETIVENTPPLPPRPPVPPAIEPKKSKPKKKARRKR